MAPAALQDAAVKAENSKAVKALEELMAKLTVSTAQDEINAAASAIATFINGDIEEADAPTKAVDLLKKQLANKKDAVVRERALDAIRAIAQHAHVSAAVEPYLVALLPNVLAAVGDKMSGVKVAAQTAAESIVNAANPNAVKAIIPHLITSLENAQKWPEKMTDLKCIEILTKSAPAQMAFRVPDLIPVISSAMWDTKPEVKKTAYGTMEILCSLISNKDIERFIPELIKCIAKPENVPETVHLARPPSSPTCTSPPSPSWFLCSSVVSLSARRRSSVRAPSSLTTCASLSKTPRSSPLSCPV